MKKNIIIIITGMPGTGKTTLGRKLSDKYNLPFISKDALKERMFDTLGWNDKAWSLKLSAASHRIMDYLIYEELKAGHSIIIESNFKEEIDSERFRFIQEQTGCALVQVLCWAKGEVAYERFVKRIDTAERHSGHVEELPLEQIKEDFITADGKDTPLKINGTTAELDTSYLDLIDYKSIYRAIETTGLEPA